MRHVSKQQTIGRKDTRNSFASTITNVPTIPTNPSTTHSYNTGGQPPSPTRIRASQQPSMTSSAHANGSGLRRTGSEVSLRESIVGKSDKLPALPLSAAQQQSPQQPMPGGYDDTQATIRHAEPPQVQTSLQTPKARGSAPTSPVVAHQTPSFSSHPIVHAQQQQQQQQPKTLLDEDEEEEEDYGTVIESEPYPPMAPQHDRHMTDLPDTAMLDSVVLPAIASVRLSPLPPFLVHSILTSRHTQKLFPRVSTQEARIALSALQRAFTDAERIIPGLTNELVNEIVDSVEHVEEVPA